MMRDGPSYASASAIALKVLVRSQRPWRSVQHRHSRKLMAMPCQILLLDVLTAGGELSDCAHVGSLGSLSAGVGVNLGIEYQDIDVLAGSQ